MGSEWVPLDVVGSDRVFVDFHRVLHGIIDNEGLHRVGLGFYFVFFVGGGGRGVVS